MYLNFNGRVWDADAFDGVGDFVPDGVAQGQADDQHVADVVEQKEEASLKIYLI